MGVPLLLTWLRRYFSKSFCKPEAMGPQDHLYVDLNSLLYPAVNIAAEALLQRLAAAEANGSPGTGMYTSSSTTSSSSATSAVTVKEAEDAILTALVSLLEKLCAICPPQRLLYIASDGVSPMGKMSHQRARRQNSTARSAARRLCDLTGFDITALTCGSSFMARVTHASHYFATMYVERVNGKRHATNCQQRRPATTGTSTTTAPLLTAIVVDATSPGEGEHKIFEAIRAFRSYNTYDHNVTHCVCSSDTDVVVSALTLHEPFLHALRFDPSGPHEPAAFSIQSFREALYERLQPRTLDEFEKALHDFVFVILLFGNDFLPRIADVADIAEGALDAFIKFLADNFVSRGKRLVNEVTGEVYMEAAVYLFDFLEELPGKSSSVLSINMGDGSSDGTADPWAANGHSTNNNNDDEEEAKEALIKRQCCAYWTMLQWAMQYCCGPVPMWNAAYPYASVPSIAQLRKYCTMDLDTVRVRGVPDEPLDVFAQLLILTPAHSVQRVLPPALRYLSDPSCSDIAAILTSRSFEDIPLAEVVAWCKSRVPRLTPEEQRRHEQYTRGGIPAVFFWDPAVVEQELAVAQSTTAAAAASSEVVPPPSSTIAGMPPLFGRGGAGLPAFLQGGGFLRGLSSSGIALSSVLPGLGAPRPTAPVAAVESPVCEALLTTVNDDTTAINPTASSSSISSPAGGSGDDENGGRGFLDTSTFSLAYIPLPANASLSTIEGSTFTTLSPFSSTSEKVHLARGAHHRKVFMRFVACSGSAVGASGGGSLQSVVEQRPPEQQQVNPFWKPLPRCSSTIGGHGNDHAQPRQDKQPPKRPRDDNSHSMEEADHQSNDIAASSSSPPITAAASTLDAAAKSRLEQQRQELLQRRAQVQRELEEARASRAAMNRR